MTSCSPKDREYIRQGLLLYWRKKKAAQMATKPITGYRLDASGKLKKKPPRMAPVLASAKHKQAARLEKKWKGKSK